MLKVAPMRQHDVDAARALAYQNYLESQRHNPDLPADCEIPELRWFVGEGGICYAAWEAEKLVGYLGFYAPFEGLFGPVLGSFSPLHGHAAIEENRAYIYSRLYEAAATDLVAQGATSHAAVLHASDRVGINSFFLNGFGVRTIDAMRKVERLSSTQTIGNGINMNELPSAQFNRLLPLHNALTSHLRASPSHMAHDDFSDEQMMATFVQRASRHFVAMDGERIVAYMEITAHGENFMTVSPGTRNICGAFMYPEYRGQGIYAALLDYLLTVLEAEGYTHLGVDFEGFNPTARGFWLKHFTATTYGVTRRIDERILRRET